MTDHRPYQWHDQSSHITGTVITPPYNSQDNIVVLITTPKSLIYEYQNKQYERPRPRTAHSTILDNQFAFLPANVYPFTSQFQNRGTRGAQMNDSRDLRTADTRMTRVLRTGVWLDNCAHECVRMRVSLVCATYALRRTPDKG